MDPEVPKPSFDGYRRWLRKELGIAISTTTTGRYELAARQLKDQTESSAFWRAVRDHKRRIDDGYFQKHRVGLLMKLEDTPEIVWKPFDSMLEKSYRKNILTNTNWPKPPSEGWILPDNWFARINDTIRTFIVVKYLDGVPFLTDELKRIAVASGVSAEASFEAREEGYYASHIYITLTGRIPDIRWDTRQTGYLFEIQVTTQLQDAIRPITHPFYVARRTRTSIAEEKWQWQYDSNEFRANYLAHTLHHVEALILDVRDRPKGGIA